jgi:thiamine transport system permease protein
VFAPAERIGWIIIGAVVLAGMALAIGAAGVALLSVALGEEAARSSGFDSYVWRVVRFTLYQAALSTLLAVAFAVPVARALARRPDFPGRTWLLRLFAVPLGLPAIVAALGLIEIWGRNGVVNALLAGLGRSEPWSVYGLGGILIAHVFFNMPLAARLILAEIERAPSEYWRNAAQLGLPPRRVFTLVEWPLIRRVLPGIAGLVFMLCATSFTLVLLLGGGPRATTIEVAIYHALRFDFDPPRAVLLALLQIGLTAAILALLAILPRAEEGSTGGGALRRHDVAGGTKLVDVACIVAAALFVAAPILSVAVAGLSADLARLVAEPVFHRALTTSLLIGLSAACLSLLLSIAMIQARHAASRPRSLVAAAGLFRLSLSAASSLILLVPPVVLGAGWFVLLRGRLDVFSAAPVIVVVINAFMALPFVMRILAPAHASHAARTDRLSASLGLLGPRKLMRIDAPALARPLMTAVAFAMALSLGDLGAIALFGSQDVVTLPYLLFQRMGSYRTDDAAGLALILGLICLVFMIVGTRSTRLPQARIGAAS